MLRDGVTSSFTLDIDDYSDLLSKNNEKSALYLLKLASGIGYVDKKIIFCRALELSYVDIAKYMIETGFKVKLKHFKLCRDMRTTKVLDENFTTKN